LIYYLELNKKICKYTDVEIKKNFLYLGLLLLLTGCFQSSAMVGPVITVASTGNLYEAGYSIAANRIVEKETGMSATSHVSSFIEDTANNEPEFDQRFIRLVKSNLEISRKKIIFQNKEKFK